MPAEFKEILTEKIADIRVGVITLNRPAVHNALNESIRYELLAALEAFAADDEVGAVVITGAGEKSFSVGADLKSAGSNHSVSDFTEYLPGKRGKSRWYDLMIRYPKGLVSAVNGYCAGSGLQLAVGADFMIASSNAAFWMPQVRLGLAPHAGTMVRMARNIGPQRVLQMALAGKRFTASEAHACGLVIDVVEPAKLLDAAKAMAAELALSPTFSVQVTKEAFLQGLELSWEQLTRVDEWKEFCIYQTETRKKTHSDFVEKRHAGSEA